MKKTIILVLITAMFFTLASCGNTKAAGAATPGIETLPQTQAATSAPAVQPEAVPEAPASVIAEEKEAPAPAAPEADANVVAQAQAALASQAAAKEAEEAQKAAEAAAQEAANAAAAPSNDSISASANGYTIEVLSARKTKDGLGNDCIFIRYKFTNNSKADAAFWQVTDQTVTQNGTALSPEGIVCGESEMMNSYSQISGGQTIVCGYPYPCLNDSDALEVKVSIYNYNTATTYASAAGTIYIEK